MNYNGSQSNSVLTDSMVLLQELSEFLQADDPEERQIVTNVSWENYEALLNDLGDSPHFRVTYLDGVMLLVYGYRNCKFH